jgi:hypothetical protein
MKRQGQFPAPIRNAADLRWAFHLTTEGPFVKSHKFFSLAAAAAVIGFAAAVPQAQAEVNVGINLGPAPVCPYGYYSYAPYDCAPYGYYGPESSSAPARGFTAMKVSGGAWTITTMGITAIGVRCRTAATGPTRRIPSITWPTSAAPTCMTGSDTRARWAATEAAVTEAAVTEAVATAEHCERRVRDPTGHGNVHQAKVAN